MKNTLSFFLDVARLKIIPRTGWVWLGVKDPETIAEHSFRTAFLAWILGTKTNLNVGRMIEMALLHELCEVYAGDLTPYHGILPKGNKKRKEMLQRWIRLPQKEKAALAKKKFVAEKKALLKLIKPLEKKTQQEIYSRWLDYEKGFSKEGKFVKQLDKLEAILQAIEYFGTKPNTPVVGWWEEVEELVEHPVLKEFVQSIERHFYDRKRAKMSKEIEFFLQIGRLKVTHLSGWVIRKVKNPDSFANHLFMLAVISWILTEDHIPRAQREKILKMSLCYNICSVYMRERTAYDSLLKKVKTDKERYRILEKWIRFSLKEKQQMFYERYQEEWKAFQKLISLLDPKTKKEMKSLWKEFKQNQTKEAHFVNQMHVLELLLQALLYWEKNKRFPIKAWWEWAFEFSDLKLNLAFMEALKRHFIGIS